MTTSASLGQVMQLLWVIFTLASLGAPQGPTCSS